MTASIYQLKITLKRIKPPIWRRIQTPADISLAELHSIIQDAVGWYDCHLHAFHVGEISYSVDEPELELDMEDEQTITLRQAMPHEKAKIGYEYDFGDGWEHDVVLEKVLPVEDGVIYPRCIKGARACPPEDCGGPWGYQNMLEALADLKHKEHKTFKQWIGGRFDPEAFDLDNVNQRLKTSH